MNSKIKIIDSIKSVPLSGVLLYLNIYNINSIKSYLNSEKVYATFDGISTVLLWNLFKHSKVVRLAPDFDSYFGEFLKGRRIHIIGSDKKNVESFVQTHSKNYNIISYLDGYQTTADYITHLKKSLKDGDIVLLGMGSPLQEEIGIELYERFGHSLFVTCGAFISQYSQSGIYYPELISKLHLRWLYRFVKEGTWIRIPALFIGITKFVKELLRSNFVILSLLNDSGIEKKSK